MADREAWVPQQSGTHVASVPRGPPWECRRREVVATWCMSGCVTLDIAWQVPAGIAM